ncbi:ABC transporter ATP-binding protein [Metabacillus herbersteinensis]|uniref:ABC transporter ATP-binding protein n=1 Tax=Metabacillus herbersteinensis TaxID=283816 RepID=A0ABV6GGY3_9BACI
MGTKVVINDVSKSFGTKTVLRNISLQISQSEIFGLLGPSGAGKTTLVKCIAGIDEASTGSVTIFGGKMPSLAVMKEIGYMTQSDALYEELTALENLNFFAAIYGLKGTKKKERITSVMRLVNLEKELKQKVGEYSGGMKRRLSLAISLLHEPKIIILDEPTVGIDPVLRQSIWMELERLSKAGTTVIVTTHVMDEAEKCHRLGMIRDGDLIALGTPKELKKNIHAENIEEVFIHYGGVKK